MPHLTEVARAADSAVYRIEDSDPGQPRRFIATTPESRRICNDPLCVGVEYTRTLRMAYAKTLRLLTSQLGFAPAENEANVLHILRGGLNFGLREALADAFKWNRHSSSFLSAQRFEDASLPTSWRISEDHYRKLHLRGATAFYCGDVVASGASLQHALDCLWTAIEAQTAELRGFAFFTIGGPQTERIFREFDTRCKTHFPSYPGSTLVYLEGRFEVATAGSALTIKLPGTDLLRGTALLAPEFLQSQYESPRYPLERCAIYDAGSRSFDIAEHLEDVRNYWRQLLVAAQAGRTFASLLNERFSALDPNAFSNSNLEAIATERLSELETLLR